VIRQSELRDAPAIAAMHVRTWQSAYAGVVDDDYLANLSLESRTTRWRTTLSDPEQRSRVYVVVNDDRAIIGHVSFGPGRDADHARDEAWEIYSIYVDPEYQGNQYGAQLLRAALKAIPPTVSRVTLWVLTDNIAARKFYVAQGFEADGQHQDATVGEQVLDEMRYSLHRD
jgi:ribosomal protein S18 acetylase RimI-like enzyme